MRDSSLIQKITDYFKKSIGEKFSRRMITYIDEEVRIRERELGYLKVVKLQNSSVLNLGFT